MVYGSEVVIIGITMLVLTNSTRHWTHRFFNIPIIYILVGIPTSASIIKPLYVCPTLHVFL